MATVPFIDTFPAEDTRELALYDPTGLSHGTTTLGEWQVPYKHKQVTYIPGRTPNIMAGLVAAGLHQAKGLIMNHALRFPEEARRIGFEKQIGAEQLALQSMVADTKFANRQIKAQLKLNSIKSVYNNPLINDRFIMESFMDKEEWHGKKLKPAHLVCFIPSEEQLVALRSFKEEYGVMCDIPNVETAFYEGMPPDVIRYRNLDDDSIKGVLTPGMRTFLASHLLSGIKIVQTTSQIYDLMSADEYQDRIFRLNIDLSDKSEEIEAKDKKITFLEGKIDNAKEEAKRECAQEASELQKRITETENKVNEINRRLREKIEELAKAKDEAQGYKETSEELTQKLNDERRKFLDERDQINALNKKLEEDVKDLAAKTEELNQLKIAYQAKVRELDVCKLDKADAKPCPAPRDPKGTCQLVKELIGEAERPQQTIEDNG